MLEDVKNSSTELISAALASLFTMLGFAFKAGARNKELATKAYVDKRLEGYARADRLDRIEEAVDSIRDEQNENFRTIIHLLVEKKRNSNETP